MRSTCRPPSARAGSSSSTAQFDALKPRLRALLEHAARATGATAAGHAAQGRDRAVPCATGRAVAEDTLEAGATVGPYRLLRPLGAGGMGEVWLAERTDMLQRRQVALKLPHLLTGRAELAERLAREREILATLEHPNIARLYDAGLTADGQPYLALEYVEGERIDDYCDAQGARCAGAAAPVPAGGARGGACARPPGRAPGPEARQHPGHRGGRGAAARLRHRQAAAKTAGARRPS